MLRKKGNKKIYLKEYKIPLKINVGCGTDYRDGFVNIDGGKEVHPDLCIDINENNLKKMFKSGTVDYILANDIIEHFFHWEAIKLIECFYYLLQSGGICEIRVPDTGAIVSSEVLSLKDKILMLYGGQDIGRGKSWNESQDKNRVDHPDYFCHKYGWTIEGIEEAVVNIGFSVISVEKQFPNFVIKIIKE